MESQSIQDILTYLRGKKGFLHEQFGVTRIGVFGSVVENRQTAFSDLDMVVELDKNKKNIHGFLQLKRFLEKELSREIDIGFEHTLKPAVKESIKERIVYV